LCVKQLKYLHCGPIELQIEAAEIIGLYGASGSGKSRLLRALADLDEHQGEVLLNDALQQSMSAPQWRRRVGLLSAETFWWLDDVSAHFKTFDQQQAIQLGLPDDVGDWPVSRLSSGENQRLGLMRLLENRPEVLLLDEPTANLDPQSTDAFERFVVDYVQQQSACAIWVSHDPQQLKRTAHRCYQIENGMLAGNGECS
jgi:ABC-type iron transport system FetAB ATPase subunit